MIVTVLITRLALKTNVLTHANYPSRVERVVFARPLLTDLSAAVHQAGLETLTTNVTNVGK
jgi:hypothetical protein